MSKIYSTVFLSLAFLLAFAAISKAQKMSPEEVVAKHLESIGTAEKRAGVRNQLAFGDVQLTARGGTAPAVGKFVIYSEGEKNLWGMNLSSNEYPSDKFAYDGKSTKVGYIRPGVRSNLGGFIVSYNELLKEGLLGGTLTSSWALLNTDLRKPKLSYEGTKKIEGKETYVLSYSAKKGSDLNIKMYFDAKTFQHVRTEYNRIIGARQGTGIDNSASQSESRYRVTENFSDFKRSGDLTLPNSYSLTYEFFSSQAQTSQYEWKFNVTNVSYNQQMDDNAFEIDAK